MNVEMSAVCTGFAFNKMKIGIPEALSKGMYNYNLLSRITRNSRHIRILINFQFRLCIGTNIETGEQVVLNKIWPKQ
jgi:NTE family protein